ncbi:MAG TPA: molybdopterin-guanine dinucleotide biosynthesis protein B [Candidatus Nanopusillus sp.]|nr:molybdopterin-guanine dinucleotide biosynthesis protein B [Candidatus Nanopusillus sp.]
MKVLSVVGPSKAGKTTLIEKIIPILIDKGLRVLVIKHAISFEIDREGKDSYRLFRCGADVVLSSKEKLAFIARFSDDLEKICNIFGKYYDIIITEGFNSACKDRIIVLNKLEEFERFKCGRILAIVTNYDIKGYRCFSWKDIDKLVKLILEWLKNNE